VLEARRGIGDWLTFYNDRRLHQALGYCTPREVFHAGSCGYVDNASALTTSPQAHHQQERDSIDLEKVLRLYHPIGPVGELATGGTLS
jgi:transposase InsO family protein